MISVVADWTISKGSWERDTMLNIAKRGRSLYFKCYVASVGLILFYSSVNIRKFYQNWHQQTQRRLVYQFSYPYNIQKSPNYEITFFTQLSGGIFAVFTNTTVDTFVSMLLLHVCAQLRNLRTSLNKLVDESTNSLISSRFKEGLLAIIERHECLIR